MRQKFHLIPPCGWMNDPNGLIYYGNRFHFFYQHHPFSTKWGPMHWGHAVTDDFVKWEHLPIALAPGGSGDRDGCFSGTAIEKDGKLYLMYTGFNENGGGESIRQVQCLAESPDGVRFEKYLNNPVIGSEMLPEGYCPAEFRDPSVFEKNGEYFCLIGALGERGGNLLLYKSVDLIQWHYVGEVFDDNPGIGKMLECPDYFEISGQGFLIVSPQFAVRKGIENCNVHTTLYYKAEFDSAKGIKTTGAPQTLDYGFDFYAAQTMTDGKNTIMTAWAQMWDRNIPSEKHGWAGSLALPRILTVTDGQIYQTPCDLSKYYNSSESFEYNGEFKLEAKATLAKIDIECAEISQLDIKLRAANEIYTSIYYDKDSGELVFDRSKSGELISGAEKDEYSLSGIRKMPAGNLSDFSIIMDIFSIEIFAGGRSMTSNIYPPDGADALIISGKTEKIKIIINRIKV